MLNRDKLTIEPCAPVEIIDDRRATRLVVDLTESDEDELSRGMDLIYQGREVLARIERQMQWRLEARAAVSALGEEE